MKQHLDSMPPDASALLVVKKLCEEHSETEAFVLDLWPADRATLVVFGAESSMEVSNKFNLPKPKKQVHMFRPLTGGESVLTMNGDEWKKWRALFNPGFSASHMARLIPTVIQSAETFCDILRQKAGKGVFRLDSLTTRLTMEIITKVTLDMNTDNQYSEHPLSHAFNTILNWNSFWNISILLKPVKFVVQKYYGRILESIISTNLETHYQEMLQEEVDSKKAKTDRPLSIMAMALRDYIEGERQKGIDTSSSMPLDPGFAKISANQIRTFLMAGNDSSSATLIYIYHLLSQHPRSLLSLREEHDALFGPDPDDASRALKQNPALLNQCRYTLAVVKETLRLFPPASTQRAGQPGVFIKDLKGNFCSTENLDVTILHHAVHMNPRIWKRPDEFLPERWLTDSEHELHVPANSGAFRPFEQGPRNCIGQSLVNNELRIILVLTARSFDIIPAYKEWDTMRRGRDTLVKRLFQWRRPKEGIPNTIFGETAYPTARSGGYAADGYPCRVSLRKS
ncbi:unnamed protein product [Periconia digitata]|uniref:Cytochrome P450 n=1 Tax=Periconia digitata TaxID=1303443 RepID=A0A9W4XG20_9PLEO|nr:unnamed protein product [Periconia digitata]